MRAREQQLLQWVERERPDVVCLQEIKAVARQCRPPSARSRATGATGTASGLLGRRAAPRARVSRRARVRASGVRPRARIVTAPARATCCSRRSTCPTAARTSRPRCAFSRRSTRRAPRRRGPQTLVSVRRPQRRAHRATCTRRCGSRTQIGSRRTSARCSSGCSRAVSWTWPRARSGQRRPVHLVGAVAQPARAQHRLAARLRAREPAARRARESCRAFSRGRHQRPRPGRRDVCGVRRAVWRFRSQ